MRITGVYPPPLTTAPSASEDSAADELEAILARPPRVTRYDRRRPPAARVWAGTSVLLAAAGVGAIAFLPAPPAEAVRVDVPVVEAAPSPPPLSAPATPVVPTAPVVPVAAARVLPASEPVAVRIPALGVTSRVMHLGLERDGSMEVPRGAHPVGWYDGSPTPGQLGPSVMAGHVDWDGERGAFYGLRELRPGDEVDIERADGTTATFRVDRVEEHPKDEFPTEDVYGDLDHAGLRLITCGGSFDEETGDYRDNVVVFATLTV